MRICVRFAGTTLAIESEGASAERVARVLFSRLDTCDEGDAAPECRTLSLRQALPDDEASISVDGVEVQRVLGAGALAEFGLTEAAYHLIDGCRDALVLHAGLVSREQRGLLLPAQSGSGKSTLTAWLVTRGFRHLSDELACLREPGEPVEGFRRPVELKAGGRALIEPLVPLADRADRWLDTREGCMIDARLLGACESSTSLCAVVFPRYVGQADPAAPLSLARLSPAQAAARLMQNCLNARHLPGHGLPRCAAWARALPTFELSYSNFDGVLEALDSVLDGSANADAARERSPR